MKTFFQKYKHAWVFLYAIIYFPWFLYLEKTVTSKYHIIHIGLDDKIPFLEFFIVPYLMWFGFVTFAAFYFFFKDRNEFYKMAIFTIIGMTVFLIISTIYPNGQDLRPTIFARDNIFVDMVKRLYQGDTPTNIFPSIHVYNSIAVFLAVRNSQSLKGKTFIQVFTFTLTLAIVLSTVFLKQHSVVDIIGAIAVAIPAYHFAYRIDWKWAQIYNRITI